MDKQEKEAQEPRYFAALDHTNGRWSVFMDGALSSVAVCADQATAEQRAKDYMGMWENSDRCKAMRYDSMKERIAKLEEALDMVQEALASYRDGNKVLVDHPKHGPITTIEEVKYLVVDPLLQTLKP